MYQPQYNQGNTYPPSYNPNYPQGGPPPAQIQRAPSPMRYGQQQQPQTGYGQQQRSPSQIGYGQHQQTPSQMGYGQPQQAPVNPYQAPTNNSSIPGIGMKILLIVNLLFLVHTIFPQGCLMIPNAIDRYRYSDLDLSEVHTQELPYAVPPYSLSAFILQCHYRKDFRIFQSSRPVLFQSHRGGLLIPNVLAFAVPISVELPTFLTNIAWLFITIMFLLTLVDDQANQSRMTYSRAYMFINLGNPGLIIKLFYIFYELVKRSSSKLEYPYADLWLFFLWWVMALAWCLVNGLMAMSFSKSSNQGPMLPMQGQPGPAYIPGAPQNMIMAGGEYRSNRNSGQDWEDGSN